MNETVKIVPPKTLKKGATIGLAPLAGPFREKPYQQGIRLLRDQGFNVKTLKTETPGAYLAGSDQERLNIFYELWKDPDVAGVLAIRGGYGTIRLLKDLDFDLIRSYPKPLIGFSDISGFLNVITQKTGLTTFHGPNLTTLCQCDQKSLESFFHTLTRMVPFELKGTVEILRSGTAQGSLAGGNLSTINHLLGTPYDLNFDNKILILEDINEAPYAIDRLIYQLYLSGKFKHLKGLILGEFSNCGDIETIWQMILDLLADTIYPIWGDFPVGHQEQNILWPVGGIAQMDSTNGILSYHERVMVKD